MNPEVLYAIAVALVFCASFLGVGGGALGLAGLLRQPGDALRLSPIAVAIGFSVFSYVGYLLVALKVVHPAGVALVLVCGLAAGGGYWRELWRDARTSIPQTVPRLIQPLPLVLIALSGGFLVLAAMQWLTPVKEGDALTGYFFTARWLFTNGFTYSPYNTLYSLYPSGTETVFALSFAFGNDIAPKAIDVCAGLFLLAGVYECARRYAGPLVSFFAPASLAIMNGFAANWASGKVEVLCTLTLFSAVSVLSAHQDRPATRTVVIGALLAGTASGQKYTIWMFAAAYGVGLVWLLRHRQIRIWIRQLAVAASVMFLCLVPHFVKTMSWTGNPIAPFGRDWFPTTGVYLNPFDFSDAAPMGSLGPALVAKLFFDAEQSRWPGPFPLLLLIGLPLALVRGVPRGVRQLAGFAVLQLGVWIAVRGHDWLVPRFLLVPTALLLVVAVVALHQAAERQRFLLGGLTALMAVLIAYSGIWGNRDWRRAWPFVLGYETREAFYDRYAPARAHRPLTAIAPLLGPERRLFLYVSQYYIPEEKLPFISTEQEIMVYHSLPEYERLQFLRDRCFGFVHIFGDAEQTPSWMKTLPLVAEWDGPGGGLDYGLFAVGSSCGAAPPEDEVSAIRANLHTQAPAVR
jgi:hypothetical protein